MCRRMPTDEDIPGACARGVLIEFGSRRPQSALFKDSGSDMYACGPSRQFRGDCRWHCMYICILFRNYSPHFPFVCFGDKFSLSLEKGRDTIKLSTITYPNQESELQIHVLPSHRRPYGSEYRSIEQKRTSFHVVRKSRSTCRATRVHDLSMEFNPCQLRSSLLRGLLGK